MTNRYAKFANLGKFKTDLISREIVKVNRQNNETMLFQINSKSFKLRIRLIEPEPLVSGLFYLSKMLKNIKNFESNSRKKYVV